MTDPNDVPVPIPSEDQRSPYLDPPVTPEPFAPAPAAPAYGTPTNAPPPYAPPAAPPYVTPAYVTPPHATPTAPNYGAPGTNYAPPVAPIPGRTLGIIGFILAFLFSLAGIVVSAIALHQSRRAGRSNGLALAGLIVSIVGVIADIILIVIFAIGFSFFLAQCAAHGTSVQGTDGSGYSCTY